VGVSKAGRALGSVAPPAPAATSASTAFIAVAFFAFTFSPVAVGEYGVGAATSVTALRHPDVWTAASL